MVAGKYISTLLIVLSLAVVAMSFNIEGQSVFDPSSPAFFPALVGVVMLISALMIARRGVQSPSSAQEEDKAPKPVAGNEDDEELEKDMYEVENITQKGINIRLILFTLLVVLFAVLMNYFNFMVLSFLFLFGAMLLLSREKVLRSLILSAVFAVGFYYIFVYVFHFVFPS
ncbi:tripartite tricarboxylate transporter TctB family protein [Brevibacillus panacihumi]|uniref:Tripartite tricarboxylate transporter TctB family protein n=1 Tax=Brevibacillus panacihumi TaxID=497735 RepID=A0A3M8CZE0_9BACL|nr:tripartite tricarboxylate transporter TctB family protein [Brevibacillus panacihumi]RNB80809.1 tripartite tricarboxylate transporter TctB family protein [Brevibacillus panacihumi]